MHELVLQRLLKVWVGWIGDAALNEGQPWQTKKKKRQRILVYLERSYLDQYRPLANILIQSITTDDPIKTEVVPSLKYTLSRNWSDLFTDSSFESGMRWDSFIYDSSVKEFEDLAVNKTRKTVMNCYEQFFSEQDSPQLHQRHKVKLGTDGLRLTPIFLSVWNTKKCSGGTHKIHSWLLTYIISRQIKIIFGKQSRA